jgi:hypothetical protein
MAETKHTPGPWSVAPRRQVLASNKRGLLVAQVATGSVASSIGSAIIDEAEGQANACLIAAAPELLEALKDLIDDLEIRSKNGVVDCSHGVYCNARQAISKAEPHHPHTAENVTQGWKSE